MNDKPLRKQARRMGTVVLMFIVFLLALATYVAFTNAKDPLGPDAGTVGWLIAANLIVLFILSAIVLRRVMRLWRSLRRGSAGSQLQSRVVMAFSLVTLLPTLVITVFAAVLFQYGIKTWFDQRVSTALEESVTVAEAYLREHKDTLRADALEMSRDLAREISLSVFQPQIFSNILNGQVALRDLSEALVLRKNIPIARSALSFSLMFESLPAELMEQARKGEIPIIDRQDRILAIVQIDPISESYLIITRLVDPKVLGHMDQAHGSVAQYLQLKSQIGKLQIQFTIVFVLMACLLLLSVMWYGMLFASKLVVPLSRLINATERVRAGDYSTRLEVGNEEDEISTLIRRFNRMTDQLRTQREDLTQANRELDQRSRFGEAVLEGVSAGIIALDIDQRIRLCNRAAQQLLQLDKLEGGTETPLSVLLPAFAPVLRRAWDDPYHAQQEDITLQQENRAITLMTRITAEMQGGMIEGFVVTFDDISPLLAAQRRAAWADVARRVAHEIKNPLTPITLSAERLRKKFTPSGDDEKEAFNRYLDTITRHIRDIGSIVEEFVSFARMPMPKLQREQLKPLLQKAAFSAETAAPGVTIDVRVEHDSLLLLCDESQMNQVFTNLLKNACEAIDRRSTEQKQTTPGHITVDAYTDAGKLLISVTDNGPGLPEDKLDKLTEPYVTTREKGTGLGLAIVKKIVEDHKGSMSLANQPSGGACITLAFPLEMNAQIGH
jgi:two-component system nitrogen regulation sensor histidine kinase NtrY